MNHSVSTPKLGSKQESTTASQQQTVDDTKQSRQPMVSTIVCQTLIAKSNPTTMRMCPPATLRNWKFHKPLLAVGNSSGVIQIFNLATGKLYRELSVHAHSVKGIEWIGLNAFLSYAESEPPQASDSNWELHVTELDTGRTVQLKCGKSSESSVIQSVKASHLRQYFIIIYKSEPFEIWDLDTLSLIKRVPKKFSGIVAAEWNPLYSKKVESNEQQQTNSSNQSSDNLSPLRENFVVTNKMGELFHFSIAGDKVKEISKIPPESTMTKAVTAIAWKSDHVILGRSDGSISVWDLGLKESRTVSTMRGSIKRIRFAPGRGNMKILILFDDGCDIWDVRRLRLVSTIIGNRSPFSMVEDSDWAASDRPVILTSNGSVVVTSLDFEQFSTAQSPQQDSSQRSSSSETIMTSKQNNSTEPCNLQ